MLSELINWWLPLGILFFALLFYALDKLGIGKNAVKDVAASQEVMFHSGFRWAPIDLKRVRGLDLPFYGAMSEALAKLEFRPLGDVEYLHATEAEPKMRTGIRLFASKDGEMTAAVFHFKVPGLMGLLSLLTNGKRHHKVIEFETALDDGRFIATTNLGKAGGMSLPSEILRYYMPSTLAPKALHQLHKNHLQQHLIGSNRPQVLKVRTLDEIMVLESKQHALEARHREETGVFSEQELATICPLIDAKERAKLVGQAQDLKANR